MQEEACAIGEVGLQSAAATAGIAVDSESSFA